MVKQLSDHEIDALHEAGNVGARSASIAMSAILNQEITINTPENFVVPKNEVPQKIIGANETVAGIYSRSSAGISGNILLVFPMDASYAMLKAINGKTRTEQNLQQDEIQILKKIGSVLCASYLSALSRFFQTNIVYRKTRFITTFGKSISDFVLTDIQDHDQVLVIKLSFAAESRDIKGEFIFLFTLDSIKPLLQKLQTVVGGAEV